MFVHHRRADHAVTAEQDRDLLLVHVGRDLAEITLHDLTDAPRPRRTEELAKADLTDRTPRRVDNEDEIEIRIAELRVSQEIDGLADRPE